MKNFLFFLVVCVNLVGCGSAAKFYGKYDDAAEYAKLGDAAAATEGAKGRVVVVRWPAVVLPPARSILTTNHHNWVGVAYDPILLNEFRPLPQMPDLLESASTFFAAELYWALKAAQPGLVVLLEPQVVRVGMSGEAELRPLVDSQVSADLVVDLWAPPAYGDILGVAQLFDFAIATAPIRRRQTCGLILTTEGHQPIPAHFDRLDCNGGDARQAPQSHFLLDGEVRPDELKELKLTRGLPLKSGEVTILRGHGYGDGWPLSATMNEYVKNSRPQRLADAEETARLPVIDNYARVTLLALDTMRSSPQADKLMARYAKDFDESLSIALEGGGQLTEPQIANLALLRKIHSQEIMIRAQRDAQLSREIFAGDFGRRFRKARDAAYDAYGSKMRGMWLSTVLTLGMYQGQLQSGTNALAAQNQAMDFLTQQQQSIGRQYIEMVAPSLSRLGQATVSIADQSVSVDISDQSKLRSSLIELYNRYRSVK